ncbi:hypothetical protein MLD38_031506 [Melastoma candidum]|uniref:Uncharacterized protein n=1 Tax=Melastoma candidum TaxID=119954 RepID=A0ACB9MPY0_9MYRT|nr:hypothetical protein MLD38_031506 [Melastoma candidum]
MGSAPSSSSSRPLAKDSFGFTARLEHVDSSKNLTKFERVRRAVGRGRHRLQRIHSMVLAAASSGDTQVEAPIHAGNGEFLMQLSIGTPPNGYSAIVDTGSDLIWTQCQPCSQCFNQSTPIFDPKKSSTYSELSCSSKLCEALPESNCGNSCEYLYTYGDYSSTQGVLAADTFTFGGSGSDHVAIKGVGFGCGEDNEGDGFSQGAGLVGLGRGPLSLVSQIGVSKFSYCLTSIDDTKSGKLQIGSHVSTGTDGTVLTTPLIKNPAQPSFYYLSLQGISVGGTHLPIQKSTFELQDDGSGGLIIDSGTTITYLEQSAYSIVRKAFISQTKLPVDDSASGTTGLDLCFKLPKGQSKIEIPKLVLHFEGADLDLPGDNYMIADSDLGLACLAMGSSSGMSILGNIQQQNIMVVHDLVKETMSFVPTQCD